MKASAHLHFDVPDEGLSITDAVLLHERLTLALEGLSAAGLKITYKQGRSTELGEQLDFKLRAVDL